MAIAVALAAHADHVLDKHQPVATAPGTGAIAEACLAWEQCQVIHWTAVSLPIYTAYVSRPVE